MKKAVLLSIILIFPVLAMEKRLNLDLDTGKYNSIPNKEVLRRKWFDEKGTVRGFDQHWEDILANFKDSCYKEWLGVKKYQLDEEESFDNYLAKKLDEPNDLLPKHVVEKTHKPHCGVPKFVKDHGGIEMAKEWYRVGNGVRCTCNKSQAEPYLLLKK